MVSFYVWSIFIILYQTVVSVVTTWLTLECHLAPDSDEAHELTLIKMLYLYEPETCHRDYYYNYTVPRDHKNVESNMLWMEFNPIASSFRSKMKLWMSLHLAWLGLALLNVSFGRRPCGLYAVLLPLTIIGIALLVVDLVHASLFLVDAIYTRTETEIWSYIGNVKLVKMSSPLRPVRYGFGEDDTSWVALLFAYASLRGIVQWIVNFWVVQDNYFDGLHYYRELRIQDASKRRTF